jgi:hypothetical protein
MGKLINVPDGVELAKRTYMNGLELTVPCKSCGKTLTIDLSTDYLNYPTMGQPSSLFACCNNCEGETELTVIPRMTLEVVES